MTFGASITAGGWSSCRERCWASQLARLINEFQHIPVQLVNVGIGANLIRMLLQEGHKIVGCLLPGDGQEPKLDGMEIEKVYADILDTEGMTQAIKNADVVVHTAAVQEPAMSKMSQTRFFDINVKGAFNVLEGVRQSGRRTHLICLSSTAVYDVFTAPRTSIKEDQHHHPSQLYYCRRRGVRCIFLWNSAGDISQIC